MSSHWRTSCTRARACPAARHSHPCAQPRTWQDGAHALCAPLSPSLQLSASVTCTRHGFRDPHALAPPKQLLKTPGTQVCSQEITATGQVRSLFRNSLETNTSAFRKKVKNYFLSLTKTPLFLFLLKAQCFFIATASISSSVRFSMQFISMWLRKANIYKFFLTLYLKILSPYHWGFPLSTLCKIIPPHPYAFSLLLKTPTTI